MKKLISVILAIVLCLNLAACSSAPSSPEPSPSEPSSSEQSKTASEPSATSSDPKSTSDSGAAAVPSPQDHETFKIGVLEIAVSDETVIRQNYYNNYIAPHYNCEFMFSEACTSTDLSMTFIENAADAGCKAIISFYPMDVEQLTQLCQEKGMVYVINGNRNAISESTFVGGYENFAGGFAADQKALGVLFYDYLKANLTPEEEHGFIVATGLAFQGAAQQYEIAINMMRALEEIYDIKFETSIEDLVKSAAPIEAKNDKGIEVYMYPGAPNVDGFLAGLASALQTGKFDYMLYSLALFAPTAVSIQEIEKSFNKNVSVVSFATFGEALTNAMNTKDQFGNSSLDMGTAKFTSLVSAMAFIEVYNVLTGHADVLKNAKGEMPCLEFSMVAVTSPEDLSVMETWDKGDKWVGDTGLIDSCLGIYNPDLTPEKIQEIISGLTYENIKARLK